MKKVTTFRETTPLSDPKRFLRSTPATNINVACSKEWGLQKTRS